MDSLQIHQRQITREYMRQLATLIRESRFLEAEQLTLRFTGITRLWGIQKENIKDAAIKDASASQREDWKNKSQTIC